MKKIKIEEWIKLGEELKKLKALNMDTCFFKDKLLGKTFVGNKFNEIYNLINEVRSELEEEMFEQYDKEYPKGSDFNLLKVFYGDLSTDNPLTINNR